MADKPTPEIEAQGLKAYEQARAFERLRTWRLPLVYGGAAVAPLFLAYSAWRSGDEGIASTRGAMFMGVGFSAFVLLLVVMQWRRLLRQYAENRALLEKLESAYGDALPWVQVEQHFAALEELKREIAEGRAKD
jgi:hypothetical protein